jgi:O-acetylhomoserine (thiol)-lyase
LRDLGAAISPMAVFQILQGLVTLPLRMRAHARNAASAAELLASRPEVTGLTVEGGLVAFDIPDPQNFVAALSLFKRGADLGDLRSSVLGPSHADSRIVLSVGVEHADDILADLAAALHLHQQREAR